MYLNASILLLVTALLGLPPGYVALGMTQLVQFPIEV
jgi:hypothetical protein